MLRFQIKYLIQIYFDISPFISCSILLISVSNSLYVTWAPVCHLVVDIYWLYFLLRVYSFSCVVGILDNCILISILSGMYNVLLYQKKEIWFVFKYLLSTINFQPQTQWNTIVFVAHTENTLHHWETNVKIKHGGSGDGWVEKYICWVNVRTRVPQNLCKCRMGMATTWNFSAQKAEK